MHLLTASGAILMVFSLILSRMAVGSPERIIQSMGFWVMGVWGLLAVLYMGSNILKGEFQRKTIYMILSRPVNRVTFILGKFAGMILVLAPESQVRLQEIMEQVRRITGKQALQEQL